MQQQSCCCFDRNFYCDTRFKRRVETKGDTTLNVRNAKVNLSVNLLRFDAKPILMKFDNVIDETLKKNLDYFLC